MEQKFTTMAQEAVGDAIQSASAAGNAQVETLHVMDALLRQENGVVRSLIEPRAGTRRPSAPPCVTLWSRCRAHPDPAPRSHRPAAS